MVGVKQARKARKVRKAEQARKAKLVEAVEQVEVVEQAKAALGTGVTEEFRRAVQRYLLEQLPLGQSVLMLLSHVLDEKSLDRLYDQNRGRCYQRELSFATMVYLIRDALLEHQGSGRASFEEAKEAGELPASVRAVYAKLGRMPMAVSMALLRETTPQLIEVLPEGELTPPVVALGPSLARMKGIILDGKTIKHVEKRLEVLRNRRGAVNSGKVLAALDLRSGLAIAVEATANSEANDVSLVDGLLQQLGPAQEGEVRLYIEDRQFCDLPRLAEFCAAGHHFLVRHNANVHFHPDPEKPAKEGKDGRGRRYVEQWGWLGSEKHALRRYVRRITLFRPGEKGGDVSVVTDLEDAEAYPAVDLLEAYLARWGIENVFQQLTEVFDLRTLIGGRPEATVFQACLCFVLYNLTQVVRAYVARAGSKQVPEVSTEKLFEDCKKQLTAWSELGDPQVAVEAFTPAPDAQQVRQRLVELLGGLWRERWKKAPKQAVHRKTKTTIYPKKGYTNTYKVLEAERRKMKRNAKRHAKQLT
jgi:hypothetical protein